MEPVALTYTTTKAIIRLRWRTRLKVWWFYKRMTPFERELHDAFTRDITDAFINGTSIVSDRDA